MEDSQHSRGTLSEITGVWFVLLPRLLHLTQVSSHHLLSPQPSSVPSKDTAALKVTATCLPIPENPHSSLLHGSSSPGAVILQE